MNNNGADQIDLRLCCTQTPMTPRFFLFYQRFSSEQCLPLNAIKMHLKCHILKSSDALYLLTLLTYSFILFIYTIVEANRVDPDQQQSILCLHCLT